MTMAQLAVLILLVATTAITLAQRPFYAGSRPIGYPAMQTGSFLQQIRRGRTVRETIGDVNLINSIESMPIDNRPFWYSNRRDYEAMRRQTPTDIATEQFY
ncbi:unnamed protein product [Chilo suppressalis]|uniref:Uncharacterized protein n=1 Tax=Chilo suppressalis TaxID=168631 RepID=A0ABN8AX31_CHISP|nr:unnamed protein product [Chilo suppressalis]